ncbi:TetR/AcrR family transcriptional regulator [Gordonia rhizosphera]|uniref:Putative TetR family transcriptional regulator n=1 Tax=Gordonia rhizosphera NBRC 16068 TaxID=1108045 RepID=K6WUL9_9ACTN|nr:TetR/AcrR family transcriptional regulator [Gordonia rhizosphera]GAB90244.1 putative TetR family transcriptional regulator [Gordonia rhizosphera NBRC 16068]
MPPTTKGRRTEAAFLDAARQTFAEKGYLNTKISDIAEVAGRSTGSFYNYYDNKEQLLEALLEQFSSEVVESSLGTRHADPEAGVRAAVTAYWTHYKKYLPEIIGLFQMSMLDDTFRQRWREHRASGITQMLSGLHGAERAGYRVGLPLDALASALVNILESSCWAWLAAGGDLDVEPPDDDTAIDVLTAIWYRTVYGPGTAP